jgi:hypothetical protein
VGYDLDGVGVPAEAIVLLEHGDVVITVEQPRRGETCGTAADYGNSHKGSDPIVGGLLILVHSDPAP